MFFSRRQPSSLILVIDVQSALVRGTLVHLKPRAHPEIVLTASIAIPYRPSGGSSFLMARATEAISMISSEALRYISDRSAELGQASEDMPHRIDAVHFVLSSPWIVSQAKTLSLSFQTETPIEASRILGILADERAKMESRSAEPLVAIEEKIFDVKLNGYSVTDWEGVRAKEASVSFVNSMAGQSTIARFTQAAERLGPTVKAHFHSSLLLQHIAIRSLMPLRTSYLLLHVHDELTDVVIVDRGSCQFFGSYPTGTRSIVRSVAHAAHVSQHAAESLIALSSEGHMRSGSSPAVDKAADAWLQECRILCAEGQFDRPMPPNAIVSARDHEDLFGAALVRAYPSMRIEPLSDDIFEPQVSFGMRAEHSRIPALYVIAIHSIVSAGN